MSELEPTSIEWILKNKQPTVFPVVESVRQWKMILYENSSQFSAPIDCALISGYQADRTAYAFLAGFRSALQRLFPDLEADCFAAFCISEEGGNHPRAIQTSLTKSNDSSDSGNVWKLNGHKKFITGATEADTIFVAASRGQDEKGRNSICLVKLKQQTHGVVINPMDRLPFIPEIEHASVSFENVAICDDQILPGDGYSDYIKPFRIFEDVHVCGAVLGYLFRMAVIYSWAQSVKERMVMLMSVVREMACSGPDNAVVHIMFAGFQNDMNQLIQDLDPLWDSTPNGVKDAWFRDRKVLSIAEKAREKRLEKAWKTIERT